MLAFVSQLSFHLRTRKSYEWLGVCWAWRKLSRLNGEYTQFSVAAAAATRAFVCCCLLFYLAREDLHSVHDQVFNCYCKQIAFHLVSHSLLPFSSHTLDSIKDPHPSGARFLMLGRAVDGSYDRMNEETSGREADSFSYYYWNRFSEWVEALCDSIEHNILSFRLSFVLPFTLFWWG